MALSGPDPYVMEAIDKGNVVVFFDVAMGESASEGGTLGRIKLELFVKDVRSHIHFALHEEWNHGNCLMIVCFDLVTLSLSPFEIVS